MLRLFNEGGILFMSVLTLELICIFVITILSARATLSGDVASQIKNYIKPLGTLALVTGVLGQFIGLFMAFEHIAQAGTISPTMLAFGLRVSSITAIYGLIIFSISYVLWFGIEFLNNRQALSE